MLVLMIVAVGAVVSARTAAGWMAGDRARRVRNNRARRTRPSKTSPFFICVITLQCLFSFSVWFVGKSGCGPAMLRAVVGCAAAWQQWGSAAGRGVDPACV